MTGVAASPPDILERAAAVAGVDISGALLLRNGAHAIFELRDGIVARIGNPHTAEAAHRELQISKWLNASGIPTVEAVESLAQPLIIDDCSVTWWRLIPDHRPATPAELGAALSRLHTLDPPPIFDLLEYQPFAGIHTRINTTTTLTDEVREWLIQHYATLRQRYDRLAPTYRRSVVHGDAWQGNLVVPPSGIPVFLDLDKVSLGRPEWDLVQLAVDYTDFTRLTTVGYRSFVDAYGGCDITAEPEFRIFADIQELRWATFVLGLSHRDPSVRNEAGHRIACLRGRVPMPWTWNAL